MYNKVYEVDCGVCFRGVAIHQCDKCSRECWHCVQGSVGIALGMRGGDIHRRCVAVIVVGGGTLSVCKLGRCS